MKYFYFRSLFIVLLMACCSVAKSETHIPDIVIDWIYYNITDSQLRTVEVTRGEYIGVIVIPEKIVYNDEVYQVTSIGDCAFEYCFYLADITIPNSVTSIGDYAFYGCSNLADITIPNSVTSIGDYAFEETAWYEKQPDGPLYIDNIFYKYKGTMPFGTRITIKDGTLGIAGGAFRDCKGLVDITIPNSVTIIGEWAFENCFYLTDITIPNSVTSIGGNAFEETAWYERQPDGPLYINNIFYKYKGTMPFGTSITIKDGTSEIAGYAFSDCKGLTGITIPNSVKNIGTCAFNGCGNLIKIEIPDGVTKIGYNAFAYSGLKYVTIPGSVTVIDDFAFCEVDLYEFICMAETPPAIYSYTLPYASSATLYVPVGSKEAYQAADYWNEFGNIVEMDFTAIEDIPADDALHGVNDAYYDLRGCSVNEPAKGGIYIHNGKKVLF